MGYSEVPIPEDKEKNQYSYLERRAEILKIIVAAGHPHNINQAELARMYGVTPQMLSKDMKAIKEEFLKHSTTDAEFITQTIFSKALKKMAKTDDPMILFKAAQLAKEWNDWLFDIGRQKRTPQEMNIKSEYTLADAVKEVMNESGNPKEDTAGDSP